MASKVSLLSEEDGDAKPNENSSTPQELKRNLHGSIYQLKLLMLFMLKGLNDSRIKEFQLASEMPDEGGKFGDLIFKFKKSDCCWRCRYVQAKHTQTEVETSSGKKKTISNSELLNTKEGPFSLLMYMQSYLEMKEKITKGRSKTEIHDLVIVTNKDLLEGRQFKLKLLNSDDENILQFDASLQIGKKPARYRLTQWPDELKQNLKNPDMFALAQKLKEYGHNQERNTEGKNLSKSAPILNKYRYALIKSDTNKNGVLENKDGQLKNKFQFTDNFVNNENLSGGAKTLREMIIVQETRGSAEKLRSVYFTVGSQSKFFTDINDSITDLSEDESEETIKDFFEKLVFAVNTPNENELDDVLDAELRKYYDIFDVEFHSAYIFRKMLDWLKKKESQFMSLKEAKELLEEAECKLDSVVKSRIPRDETKLALTTDVLVDEKFSAITTAAPGPYRKDGYPNMKYKCNRDWAAKYGVRVPLPKGESNSPDDDAVVTTANTTS